MRCQWGMQVHAALEVNRVAVVVHIDMRFFRRAIRTMVEVYYCLSA